MTQPIDEALPKIRGFQRKVEQWVRDNAQIRELGDGRTQVTVRKGLDGKPVKAKGKTFIRVIAPTERKAVREMSDRLVKAMPSRGGAIMYPLTSSNIEAAGYDHDKSILYIKFNTGATYRYLDVPERVAFGLLDAPSVGRYFHAEIRDEYESERAR